MPGACAFFILCLFLLSSCCFGRIRNIRYLYVLVSGPCACFIHPHLLVLLSVALGDIPVCSDAWCMRFLYPLSVCPLIWCFGRIRNVRYLFVFMSGACSFIYLFSYLLLWKKLKPSISVCPHAWRMRFLHPSSACSISDGWLELEPFDIGMFLCRMHFPHPYLFVLLSDAFEEFESFDIYLFLYHNCKM